MASPQKRPQSAQPQLDTDTASDVNSALDAGDVVDTVSDTDTASDTDLALDVGDVGDTDTSGEDE